jgi:hypothetical protein
LHFGKLSLVVVASMLFVGIASATQLSSGRVQGQEAISPIVKSQLSVTDFARTSQSPAINKGMTAKPSGFVDGFVEKMENSKISFSPALVLFGFALGAIGWMGRKRKKRFLIKD